MPGLIGKKLGMSNIFVSDGILVPVTVIEAGPCSIINIRTKDKNGYEALQLGFGARKEKNITKPVLGQFKKADLSPAAILKEFKNFSEAASQVLL